MDPSNVCPPTSGQTPRFPSVPGSLCPKSSSPTCFPLFQPRPAVPDHVALKTNRSRTGSRVQGQGQHRLRGRALAAHRARNRGCGIACTSRGGPQAMKLQMEAVLRGAWVPPWRGEPPASQGTLPPCPSGLSYRHQGRDLEWPSVSSEKLVIQLSHFHRLLSCRTKRISQCPAGPTSVGGDGSGGLPPRQDAMPLLLSRGPRAHGHRRSPGSHCHLTVRFWEENCSQTYLWHLVFQNPPPLRICVY